MQRFGHDLTETEEVDVVDVVRANGGLIPRKLDEGPVVVEPLVLEQRLEEVLEPLGNIVDVGIVRVIVDVGGDPRPLGERVVLQVLGCKADQVSKWRHGRRGAADQSC